MVKGEGAMDQETLHSVWQEQREKERSETSPEEEP